MYLIFDTETTGLPKSYDAPITDLDNWPRLVQIAWQLHDDMGVIIEHQDFLIKPEGFNIPFTSQNIHGISTELALAEGQDLAEVLQIFNKTLQKADFVVGHNISFDINVTGAEFLRKNIDTKLTDIDILDTATEKTALLCQLPGGRGGRYKLPKLGELYKHLFNEDFAEAHNATADVEATTRAFLELIRLGEFTEAELHKEPGYLTHFQTANPRQIKPIGIPHKNLKQWSEEIAKKTDEKTQKTDKTAKVSAIDAPFSHLHNYTQYSVLQSTTKLDALIKKAAEYKMPAIAITDIDNMMGAFHFVSKLEKFNADKEPENQIKPILGVELKVVDDHTDKSKKNNGYTTIFLAKNKNGYQNLIKLSSLAHTEGYYYVPRIGRDFVAKYKDDIIVLSGGLGGEIAQKILNLGDKQAEEAVLWWKNIFGDDYYLELLNHNLPEEAHVNEVLLKFAQDRQVKVVATNSTYYIEQSDADAQDILLCIKENEKQSTPKGRGRGFRNGLPNEEFYFKSQEQMKELFKNIPQAINNIQEIVDKIESYELKRDVLLPKFDIPEEFINPEDDIDGGKRGENAYLRYLTYEGAKNRWGKITDEIRERLEFELETIEKTGYPGYFLIVQDIIREAKKMKVMCGPGRGSAAGSAVAYALQITNVDPIKYQLLFERFLNPERVSLPDIDMDFDDEGRELVIQYVINKYGRERVAQIITYGTMAAKSSIKDAARITEFPLQESNALSKKAHVSLELIINKNEEKIKDKAKRPEMIAEVMELAEIASGNDDAARTIQTAGRLEGSLRNLGLHACGFIIAPKPLDEVVPVTTAKGSDMYVTQFDNSVVESAGLLKMDFLGIKTLTVIRDALQIIKDRQGIEIDIDNVPLDDENTYKLFQRGQTVTVFQFESDGMRKHLMALRPTEFEDLVAMVALYRPGPMEKIPSYIRRKFGQEKVTYDLPEMEEYLKNSYGITIYQEQVMLLSQKLSNFTKGQADVLRKAMGKKNHALLAEMYPKYLEGGQKNGHPKEILDKIWEDWKSFASYAFNRSHAVSYAIVSYQTAYLKANYPSEYMAAVLSHNLKDASKLSFLMGETRKMGIEVLPPDINESKYLYTVNKKGNIRYGLGGASGVGQAAVEAIISEREQNGEYKSFFDFIKRVNLRAVNKRTIETMVSAGAFDCFEGTHRAQYFQEDGGTSFIEKAVKFGNNFKKNQEAMQTSLFGDSAEVQIPEPTIPDCEPWSVLQKLEKEKEVTGIYLSGHPLDTLAVEHKYYTRQSIEFVNKMKATLSGEKEDKPQVEGEELLESEETKAEETFEQQKFQQLLNKEMIIGGMVVGTRNFETKNGKQKGELTIEDYSDSITLDMWNKEYLDHRAFFVNKLFVLVKLKLYKPHYNPNQIRMNIIDIQLLNEVFEKYPRDLSINLFPKQLTQEKIDYLHKVLSKYPGSQKLTINLIDTDEPDLSIPSLSKSVAIKPNPEMIKELERMKVRFKLA
jgi:DNA polymerase-3 subunit alpha